MKLWNNIYPLTIILDRYSGTYSGGIYLAFNLEYDEIPLNLNGDDLSCMHAWQSINIPVGRGATIIEAINDLYKQLGVNTYE